MGEGRDLSEDSVARRVSGISVLSVSLVAAMLCVTLYSGCQTAGFGYRPSPLNALEQGDEIEKLAPPGTPREEVERRLKEAGVEVSPGSSPHIAYCDVWNRAGGDRWVLNVALLFDESGKLLGTRPSQSETGVMGETPQAVAGAEQQENQSSPERMSDAQVRRASGEVSSPTRLPGSNRPADRRIPFEEPKSAYVP